MKKIIRLTESDLHNIIKESVKRVINEMEFKTPQSRNKLRQAFANKYAKMAAEPGPTDTWKKHRDTVRNVKDYAKEKIGRNFNPGVGPGNSGLEVGNYNEYQTAGWEKLAYDMFDKNTADKFLEWGENVDFDPTWYGMGNENYDPSTGCYSDDHDSDVNADDAFEYELDKLDSCPVLSPEQIEKYKSSLRGSVENSQFEYNDRFEPYEPYNPSDDMQERDYWM